MQATEDYMVHLFEDTNLCAIHAKRVTISKGSYNPQWLCSWAFRIYALVNSILDHRYHAIRMTLHYAFQVLRNINIMLSLDAVPKDLQLARRLRGVIEKASWCLHSVDLFLGIMSRRIQLSGTALCYRYPPHLSNVKKVDCSVKLLPEPPFHRDSSTNSSSLDHFMSPMEMTYEEHSGCWSKNQKPSSCCSVQCS